MPYCVNCGVELKSKDRFCHKCGKMVVKSSTSAVETKVADSVLKERKTIKKEQHGLLAGLIKNLKDKDKAVRWEAVVALGKMGDSRAVEPLIEALKDEKWDVQRRAAEALGKIGDPRAVEPLKKALKDKEWKVRMGAAEELGDIGGQEAVGALKKALKDKRWWVQKAAAEALGKISDPEAVEALIETLKDETWEVQKAAAEALGKIGDPRAVEPLIEALKDDTGAVQEAAAEALGKIGDPNGVKALELFGRKKRVEESGQGRGTSTVKQELQRQRENTERCLTILTRCRTRYEIIEGLRQIETLLKQVNDPLADAAGRASVTCRTMSDKFVLLERDYFISACRAFLQQL